MGLGRPTLGAGRCDANGHDAGRCEYPCASCDFIAERVLICAEWCVRPTSRETEWLHWAGHLGWAEELPLVNWPSGFDTEATAH